MEVSKAEQTDKRIRELLKNRLNKIGSIRSCDAWELCRKEFGYQTVVTYFREIMNEMVRNGRADFLHKGVWWIFRQTNNNEKTTRL